MDRTRPGLHHAYMAKPRHFLRQWREFRGLSLEEVAEKVATLSEQKAAADPDMRPKSMTHATLSRIERGKIPYNEHLLDLLSEIYATDRASLIMRDPSQGDPLWSIWDSLRPVEREQLTEIAKVMRRTGTGG